MLSPLCIPNAYFWSAPVEGEQLVGNAYLFVTESGNVAIDPLPLDEPVRREIERLRGVASVIVLSEDRRGPGKELAALFGAETLTVARHREPLFPGAIAIALPDQGREPEFAISVSQHRTVLVGDCLLGSPAGALSLPARERDAAKAALGLRRVLRENPERLLVAHGQSLFAGAYAALYGLLYSCAGAELHRINVDALDFRNERDEHVEQPSRYHCSDAEVGFAIGARKLGYRVSTLDPGQFFCPLHGHAREEELFYVIAGHPSVRTPSGTIRCRPGDFVALPVGSTGTHQLLNESDAPATVLLLARSEEVEACYYPDSDKLLVDTEVPLAEGRSNFLVRGAPQLDYFDGES